MAVSLYHLKGFAVAVNLIEKIAKKIGYFLQKFEVGKEILKEFLTVNNDKSCLAHQFFKRVQTSGM